MFGEKQLDMKSSLILCLALLLGGLTAPTWAQSQADIDVFLSACRFFAGTDLDTNEIEAVTSELRSDFQRDPQAAAQQIAQLKAIGAQLVQAQDPFQVVAIRHMALYEFYQAYQAGDQSTSTQIVIRNANPIGLDPKSRILLLEPDLLSTVRYFDLLRQGSGREPMNHDERQKFASAIVINFPDLPDEAKTFILTSQIFGTILQNQLQQMSVAQQLQVRQQMAQQYPSNLSMSDYQALSALSRSQHLSTMNILEAAGGSDDYWSTIERPSW